MPIWRRGPGGPQDAGRPFGSLRSQRDRLVEKARRLAREQEPDEAVFPARATLTIVIFGVPGFQALLQILRGLDAAAPVEAASVRVFHRTEATMEVLLANQIGAEELASIVSSSTGHRVEIERAELERLELSLRGHVGGRDP